jgi:hypothetical protein
MVNEVGKMTQDVLRLQRERQTVEGQLSELFGFLSKQQRAAGAEVSRAVTNCISHQFMSYLQANQQASGRPTPGADGKKQAGGVRQLPGAMPAHASLVKRAATQR